MLYTQLLRDKLQETLVDAHTLAEAADRLAQEEDVFFSMRFLLQRPLLRAILSPEPPLLWGTGDSDMLRYAPLCDDVVVAAILSELTADVDHLLTRP